MNFKSKSKCIFKSITIDIESREEAEMLYKVLATSYHTLPDELINLYGYLQTTLRTNCEK